MSSCGRTRSWFSHWTHAYTISSIQVLRKLLIKVTRNEVNFRLSTTSQSRKCLSETISSHMCLTHLLRSRQACLWSDLEYNFLIVIWHPHINTLVKWKTKFRTGNMDLSSVLLCSVLDAVVQTHLGIFLKFLGAFRVYLCASGEWMSKKWRLWRFYVGDLEEWLGNLVKFYQM